MTKKARLKMAREILAKYQDRLGVCLNNADLADFTDLVGHDFYDVKVMEHPTYKNQKGFINVKMSEEAPWTTFSWVNAIKGYKPEFDVQRIKKAMRNSVQYQLWKFSSKAELVCSICESTQYPSVDHVDKSFNFIANLFIQHHGFLALKNDKDGLGWKIKNEELDQKWHQFHAEHATYRILCRSCNSKCGMNSTEQD